MDVAQLRIYFSLFAFTHNDNKRTKKTNHKISIKMTLITLYSIQNIKQYDGGDNLNVKYFF